MFRADPELGPAAADYLWLLDRGYSRQAALKLVGDRHQLPRDERMILYRGLAPSSEAADRRAAVAAPSAARGRPMAIDGYNQALTVLHYAAGRPVFLGTDGLLRDAGGSHGRIPDREALARALGLLADAAARLSCPRATIYLDAPVPGSAAHALMFREAFAARGIEAATLLEKSADAPLKSADEAELVASGDSAIADALASARRDRDAPPDTDPARAPLGRDSSPAPGRAVEPSCEARVFDLARAALELAFPRLEILDLGALLEDELDARRRGSATR